MPQHRKHSADRAHPFLGCFDEVSYAFVAQRKGGAGSRCRLPEGSLEFKAPHVLHSSGQVHAVAGSSAHPLPLHYWLRALCRRQGPAAPVNRPVSRASLAPSQDISEGRYEPTLRGRSRWVGGQSELAGGAHVRASATWVPVLGRWSRHCRHSRAAWHALRTWSRVWSGDLPSPSSPAATGCTAPAPAPHLAPPRTVALQQLNSMRSSP